MIYLYLWLPDIQYRLNLNFIWDTMYSKYLNKIARYYGPTSRLNGNTAKDVVYKGRPLEKKFETVKFK